MRPEADEIDQRLTGFEVELKTGLGIYSAAKAELVSLFPILRRPF